MKHKQFYENQKSFSYRTKTEYYISPGIKCKYDIIKDYIRSKNKFVNGIDLGCSGNSLFFFLENIVHKSFYDLANFPLHVYKGTPFWHPANGDLTYLPYRDKSFDLVTALDVLEHLKEDELAISEINRILKEKGIAIITVPHRKTFYTKQDQLIGHYRRYEIAEIKRLFKKYSLVCVRTFGVYGRLMKIADSQASNPEKTENNIQKLRDIYETNPVFKKIWDYVVKISANIMKIDAKYHSLKNVMNIGFIFLKK